MKKMSIGEVVSAIDGNLSVGNSDYEIDKVVIDSREADSDSLFFSVIGESQDGHKYLSSAYDNGCRAMVVNKGNEYLESFKKDNEEKYRNSNIIEVENTELALGALAKHYRDKFDIKVVGVTGSVGKTTTRDFVYSVLSTKFRTLKNEKNFNNQFGVPLTLFNLDDSYEAAVIEMGMQGRGEIKYLRDIVRPDIGIITMIGTSHIERLGSRENIFRAKLEISHGFNKDNTLIVNGDDDLLCTLKIVAPPFKVKQFGSELNFDCGLVNEDESIDSVRFTAYVNDKKEEFTIPVPGFHNVYNAMSAILAGVELGIEMDSIKKGLEQFKATSMRQEVIKTAKYTIINDAYNASSDSMFAALSVLSKAEGRKVAILGDMFELGEYSEKAHRETGKSAALRADVVIAIGKDAKYIYQEARINGLLSDAHYFQTKEECIENLDNIIKDGDTVLVKASRGMYLEKIVEYLVEMGGKNE